ncbi:MAG: hypothetical protein PVF52_06125 [Granulosicoccaceae bacterium]|jgi:hypothetical protein
MPGRINIVFGFLFLVATAALGPVMVQNLPQIGEAQAGKQAAMAPLQLAADTGFENAETLEPMTAAEIAQMNAKALLALNKQLNAEVPNTAIKGGPHAHGNLESLLNIVVGIVLMFLTVGRLFKLVISWVFILGTLLHSGVLYLVVVFELGWAGTILGTGIGPILLLLGLLLAGVAAAIGWKAPQT